MAKTTTQVIRADGQRGTYEWLERPHRESGQNDLFLVNRGSPDNQFSTYDALKKPELFLEFAMLESSPSAILAFASAYGSLGLLETFDSDSTEPIGMLRWDYSDSLSGWVREIDLMHDYVQLWKAIDKPGIHEGDSAFLEQRVKYSGNSNIFVYTGIRARRQIYLQQPDLEYSVLEAEERARFCLADAITQNLSRPQDRWHSLTPQVEDSGHGFTLNFVSNSFLTVLWIQFAQAVAGNTKVNVCEECGNLFAVGGRQGHTDRRFCGNNCKQRSFQKKKREARKLENPSA